MREEPQPALLVWKSKERSSCPSPQAQRNAIRLQANALQVAERYVPHHFQFRDAGQDDCVCSEKHDKIVGVVSTDCKMCYVMIVKESSILQILEPELAKRFSFIERLDRHMYQLTHHPNRLEAILPSKPCHAV